MDLLLTLSSLLLTSTAIAWGIWFGLSEPWWRHPFGQSVMTMTAGVAILSGLGLIRTVLGDDYAGRDLLVVLGRLLVAAAIIQRAYVLAREQSRRPTPAKES